MAQPLAIPATSVASSVVGQRGNTPLGLRLLAARALTAGAAIADQACVAGAGFLANVLLARWLSLEAFGSFALGWSAFLFLAALHQGAIGEPQQVFGPSRYADRLGGYLARLRRLHWWATGGGALLLAGVAALGAARGARWAPALAGVAAMLPGTLWFWLARSAAYTAGLGRRTAFGGACYLAITIGAMVVLHATGALSPATALAALGGAGLAAGCALIALTRRIGPAAAPLPAHEVLRDHRGYAGWSILAALLAWTCANLHLIILGAVGGLGAAAGMKALDTALLPTIQGFTALAQVALPALAMALAADGAVGGGRAVAGLCARWAALGALATAALWMFGVPLLALLYGPGFAAHAADLRVYALMLPCYAAATALCVALRALARADLVFAYSALYATVLAAGYAVSGRYGVAGIVWANVIAQATTLPALAWLVARALHRRPVAVVRWQW